MKKNTGLLWSIVFIIIFLLSQDYLFVDWGARLLFFGFPTWIAWFVLVHLVFIGAFYLFAKKYWKE